MDETKNINLIISDAVEIISSFVIPLYIEHRKKPVLIGSGFFVETKENLVLASAGHVLDKISARTPIFTYRKPNEAIQLTGKRFISKSDSIDLGFLILENIGLPWPEVKKAACKLEYLHAQRTPRERRYYVIAGYPETKNRANPSNKTIKAIVHAYHAYSIPDSQYQEFNLDPATHVALPLDLKKGINPHGKHANFPRPQGMSGSPIWELFNEAEEADQTRVFPLVAVGTTYKNKIVFGTDIGQLLPMLLEV